MSDVSSALYEGEVVHQRFAPKRHRLRYGVFQMLFDLDELPSLHRRLRLFSHNGFNAISFFDKDHGDGGAGALKDYVDRTLQRAGLPSASGRIKLLCMPRVFGHVFNPLSVYYCYDAGGALIAMLYEVSNTFGQRHSYLIEVNTPRDKVIKQTCDKGFFVSPFMNMDMRYEFKISAPGDRIATIINATDLAGAPLIYASFVGARKELRDLSLLAASLRFPFLTLGVVFAIHWEALKIVLKGIGLRQRPPPPEASVTVVGTPTST